MNQCIHGIDLLRWMMNDEIVEVYGKTKQQFHHYLEAEDLGMAVITFKMVLLVLLKEQLMFTLKI